MNILYTNLQKTYHTIQISILIVCHLQAVGAASYCVPEISFPVRLLHYIMHMYKNIQQCTNTKSHTLRFKHLFKHCLKASFKI